MENTENICVLKHEKLKLHMKYIIAIAVILSLGSIVLAAYDQEAFAGQVAFGATLTSIVLSVIAIWMSISGERATNDIRIKIGESTERLSKTTKEIEILNGNYEKTIENQISELKNVQEQLTQITNSISNVEKQVSDFSVKTTIEPETQQKNTMDTNQKIELFNGIFSWMTYGDSERERIFYKMTEGFIEELNEHNIVHLSNIITQLEQDNVDTNNWKIVTNTIWGILNTLFKASVFKDNDAKNAIMEAAKNKLYHQEES